MTNAIEPKPSSNEGSYWHSLCSTYRKNQQDRLWQPKLWQYIFPYPFCPTYRQSSRFVALVLIAGLSYTVLYAIVGETAAPGGKIFTLFFLTLCSYLGGYLVSLTSLPPLIGMLFVGLLLQNSRIIDVDDTYSEINKCIRSSALVIILIHAGLDLDPSAMKRLHLTILKLSLGPWFIEVVTVGVMAHYLLGFPWWWSFLLGTVIAAVAPAVVVSCIFRLRNKGYGVAKGTPTLILAASSICDATSVAIFGIVKDLMFSSGSELTNALVGGISIFGGIGFGIVWGFLTKFIPERQDPFKVPLRILLLLSGGMVSIFGSELIGYGGAGPLSCVTAAFISICYWTQQGWDIENNPVATAFEIFWLMFEPLLFGVTGTQLKLNEIHGDVAIFSFGIIIIAILVRIFGTIALGVGSGLNLKEKLFVALALIPKATVQAALGPVALALVAENTIEHTYARRILMMSLMSILMATPLGALSISLTGKWLLTKTQFPELRSKGHKLSIRDITIVNCVKEDSEAEPQS